VAQQYFKLPELTYVAAGNPKDFGTPLDALGLQVHNIDLTIPEPKQEAAKADPASLQKGKELLQHVQQALGGADKLAGVKDLVYHGEAGIETPGATMKVKQANSYLAPSSLRQDIELPFAKQSVYSNGTTGWLVTPQGPMGMTPPVLKQIHGEVFRQIPPLIMSDRDADRAINYVGDATIEISAKDGESVRISVDEKTFLPLKISYQGSQGPVDQLYSDWRDVNGVRLPFQWTIMQGDKKFASVTVAEYKVNSGLTQEEISKKP
jgi:hypothetical protein